MANFDNVCHSQDSGQWQILTLDHGKSTSLSMANLLKSTSQVFLKNTMETLL